MRLFKSIKIRLFAWYGVLVMCIMLIFSLFFYYFTANTLKKNATASMLQLSNTLNKEIDNLFSEVNDLSTRLLYSPEFINLVYSNMYNYKSESLKLQYQFNSYLYSCLGPSVSKYQVNVFRKSGEFIAIGNTSVFTTLSKQDIGKVTWLAESEQSNGAKTIVGTHFAPFFNNRKPVLSLCRTFSKQWGTEKDGFLEIQLTYSSIENIIKNVRTDADGMEIFVFDSHGNLVYPLLSNTDRAKMYLLPFENSNKNQVVAAIEKAKQTIVRQSSDFTGFDVVIAQPHSSLFAPIFKLRDSVFILSLLGMYITLLITYTISKSLTMPIKHINEAITKLTLTQLPNSEPQMINSNIDELDNLILTYKNMCMRLQTSLDEIVSMRSAEMQSRMLALQSQMNPHFLYNTLTTISILADKGEDEKIISMCCDLTDMMRYISSGSANLVTIHEELQHTQSYIELMQVRFEDDIKLSVNIPKSIENITIPKLIIQPLVENCTKYATNCAPPWHIQIDGEINETEWMVRVSDNGDGFTAETIQELDRQISSAAENSQFYELDGMGLINIYMRLFLHYGKNTLFEYGNNTSGGAFVKIGGLLDTDKEEQYEFNL